ncbi:MAG: ABC transporter permease [Anderseniella sp.]|jgi:ABC-2 type transport system permease protein/lipopolysaccharide transport system permease protein|nr:ABC transporter permease [Anderseniella sp.]
MARAPAPQQRSRLAVNVGHALDAVQFKKAIVDISDGWCARALWATMGAHEIRQRYRRSVIGPFWITISMGVMVAALGFLYGRIFRLELHDYLPYLAAGFVTWGFISGLVNDGAQTFIAREHLIRQLSAPLSIYAYRSVWTNLITFAHNVWIYIIVAAWFGALPGWIGFLALPGLLVLVLSGLWLALLLGLLSARFRDIPLMIASVMQVMFFITPVIWKVSMLPGRAFLLEFNPFWHLMELIRAPLLGHLPPMESWVVVAGITLVGWSVTLLLYTGYRWRIPYWV